MIVNLTSDIKKAENTEMTTDNGFVVIVKSPDSGIREAILVLYGEEDLVWKCAEDAQDIALFFDSHSQASIVLQSLIEEFPQHIESGVIKPATLSY